MNTIAISVPIEHINCNLVHFSDTKQYEDGQLAKIIYRTTQYTLNMLYTKIRLKINKPSQHYFPHYTKKNIFFSQLPNNKTLDIIYELENLILRKYQTQTETLKLARYNIRDMLSKGFIKVLSYTHTTELSTEIDDFVLKIGGIWEDSLSFGITFKIL